MREKQPNSTRRSGLIATRLPSEIIRGTQSTPRLQSKCDLYRRYQHE